MADRFSLEWLGRRRGLVRRGVALMAGALSALALPPIYMAPVLWICFPLLLALTLTSKSRIAAFAEGWWFGLGHFAAGLYWVAIAFIVNEDISDIAGPFAVGLLSGVMAVYVGLVTTVHKVIADKAAARGHLLPALAQILLFAVVWSAGEWLRGHLFTGFPWNLIGTVWAFSAIPMQAASVLGLYGLGLVTMIIALAPAGFLLRSKSAAWPPVMVAGSLLVLLALFGVGRLSTAENSNVDGVRLRLVQANISQENKWQRDRLADNFIRHLDMSARPNVKRPTHIIWPETAVPYFLNDEPSRRYLIANVAPPGGYVITGAPRFERLPGDGYEVGNSLFVIDGVGEIRASYDKAHLVPFGEYLPLRAILTQLGVERFVPSLLDFTAGPGVATLHVPGLPPFSPLICYEVIFPAAVARRDDPPAWILNLTNDAWYGISTGPYQHLVAARFRAVEEGVPVVRAAGTGISAVIDPWGRVTASLGLGRSGIIDADLPQKIEHSPLFARFGDWSYLIILAIVSAAALLATLRSGAKGPDSGC